MSMSNTINTHKDNLIQKTTTTSLRPFETLNNSFNVTLKIHTTLKMLPLKRLELLMCTGHSLDVPDLQP